MNQLVFGLALGSFSIAAIGSSPYLGQEQRDIKALSELDVEGYLNGSGMGFAKAAELNFYPGPKHVLELSDKLELTAQQLEQTQALFDAMKERATELGIQLVGTEALLDQRFQDGTINAAELGALLTDIAALRAEIRFTHLDTHLAQRALLSNAQVEKYVELRGYGDDRVQANHH